MTTQIFTEITYARIKEAIEGLSDSLASDIYVLSFLIRSDDDPRLQMMSLGYNTLTRYQECIPAVGQQPKWPIASSAEEAKWNYAFWIEEDLLTIGGHLFNPVEAWIKALPDYFTDEEEEQD